MKRWKKKRVYIAGGITGLPQDEVERNFRVAEEALVAKGCSVYNPFARIEMFTKTGTLLTLSDIMGECIKHLLISDCVYLLEGWEFSGGAKVEVALAEYCKIPILGEIDDIKE